MIDSHAHVSFDVFDRDRREVIERAKAADIGWIEVGTDVAQNRRAIALAQQNEKVWATVGVHPSEVDQLTENSWLRIEAQLRQKKVVAIGEVGLDFSRGGSKRLQLKVLQRFVRLAQAAQLPMVFHVRDPVKEPGVSHGAGGESNAHDELIAFLNTFDDRSRPAGVIHTFSGTYRQAEQYLELGMYLSFSGVVTFKNPGEVLIAAQIVQPDRILVETDCPFLTPEPYRGQRNEPAYVRYVAEKMAEVKGLSVSRIQHITEENTHRLFRLGEPGIVDSDVESFV